MNRPINRTIFILLVAAVLSIAALQAYADNPIEAIEWHQLSAETRKTLAPMADRWQGLKPHQQHRLVNRAKDKDFKKRAERWKELSPEQRQRIVKARNQFKEMPEEKRKKLRKHWENMSDKEKREAKKNREAKKKREAKEKPTKHKNKKKDEK
jgi:dipeptidase